MQMPKQEHGDTAPVKLRWQSRNIPDWGERKNGRKGNSSRWTDAKIAGDSILRAGKRNWRFARLRRGSSKRVSSQPTVGYTGDEIRDGSWEEESKDFVQQTIVTGGKLGLSGCFGKE
jgi:hypothetical protein